MSQNILSGQGFDCNMSQNVLSCLQGVCPILKLLQNCINPPDCVPIQQGETEMATKINRSVMINGKKRWIHANSEQEYANKLIALLEKDEEPAAGKHNFTDYALNWFEVYCKPNVGTVTATTYQRQFDRYLFPAFGDKAIEDITTDDIQRLFNGMTGAKATKQKARQVLNMVLEDAVNDGLIVRNPLKSKSIRIRGTASKPTREYSVEQMQFLIRHIPNIQNPSDRAYLAMQALHPLRLEEVLGLKWEDIDIVNMVLHIRRAVTHPTRNKPEIKTPKTEASIRDIGLSAIAVNYLVPGPKEEFVFGGKTPLSYTQVRRMCQRIKADTGFDENITPIRFRTTILTDLYDLTKDIKQVQKEAGHTTSAMTLKHYVKGRSSVTEAASVIDRAYGGISD